MNDKNLQTIDVDFIKMLRGSGRWAEAHALVCIYQQNKKENNIQLRKELKNLEDKKYKFKHIDDIKEYQKKYYERNKCQK